jgi:anti-sigma factor RsiW
MTMDVFADRLSDYLDDELTPAERSAVEAHLATCAECRSTLEALRAIVSEAAQLSDVPPVNDLWSGISARIASTRPAYRYVSVFRRMASSRLSFTIPQIAAAALALMVLSGTLVWMARSGDPRADFEPISAETARHGDIARPVTSGLTDVRYDEAVAALERTLNAGRTRLDLSTMRALEQTLAAIDLDIQQCRRALEKDPTNVDLKARLAAARQKKLTVLRGGVELTLH